MRGVMGAVLGILCSAALVSAQTAEELVAKNMEAKGGLENIKAIKTLRMTGRLQQGGLSAVVGQESKAPNLLRITFTVQNMTQVQAYCFVIVRPVTVASVL